jgi:uncharacterized protein YegP (UPF0339 family)
MMAKFVVYRDAKMEWRWRLVARNGRTIADSAEGYKRRSGAIYSVERARDAAAKAEVPYQE